MKNMMKYALMAFAVAAALCGCQSVDAEKTAQFNASCNIQTASVPEEVSFGRDAACLRV